MGTEACTGALSIYKIKETVLLPTFIHSFNIFLNYLDHKICLTQTTYSEAMMYLSLLSFVFLDEMYSTFLCLLCLAKCHDV